MPEAASMSAVARRLAPLRGRLLTLVGASVLPVVVVALIGMALIQREQRRSVEQDMVQTARALSSAVDGELRHAVRTARLLATAPSLQQGSIERFRFVSADALPVNPQWSRINLADRSGRVLTDTGSPPEPSAIESETTSFEAAVSTGKAQISALVTAPSGDLVFMVRAPVSVNGVVRYVVSVTVVSDSVLPVLSRQRLETQGVAAVFDTGLRIAARTPQNAEFLGRPISERMRALLAQRDEWWGEGSTLEGTPTYVAMNRSQETGWGILLAITRDSLDAPLLRSYGMLGIAVLLSLLVGLGAAALVARQISSSIAALKQAAMRLGEGYPPSLQHLPIPELNEMASALCRAAEARLKAEASRDLALTEAHSANAQKDALLALLTRSNAELQRFAYVASHDLQVPLRSVTNFAELVQRSADDRLNAQEQDWVRRVVAAGRRMQTLINDLLLYARLEGEPSKPSEVDLNDVLGDTLELIEALVRESGAKVRSTVLPTVMGHRSELQQLLLNLLANAIHYRSSAPPEIEVSAKRAGDTWVVSVSDNGIGIEPRHHREIFDIFRRLDPSRPGTGIGLALCRRIVERVGGSIWVESAPGRGSTFRLTLPAVPVPGEVRAAVSDA